MEILLLRFFALDPTRKCRPLVAPDPRIVPDMVDSTKKSIQLTVYISNPGPDAVNAAGTVLSATLSDAKGLTPAQVVKLPPAAIAIGAGEVVVVKFWPPTATLPANVPDGDYALAVSLAGENGDVLASDSMGVRVNDTDLYALADDPVVVAPPATDANAAIAAEIVKNDKEIVALPPVIKAGQERLAKLTARNTALKAVPVSS